MDGQPMLWRTIEAVRAVASDVVVVSAPDVGRELPTDVSVAYDAEPDQGPLAGLVAGLLVARHSSVVVVGGDMPWVRAAVLTAMLAGLEPGHLVTALEFDGCSQQLPLALRRSPALEMANGLIAGGERRLGALLDASSVRRIAEADWRRLDPDGATLRDIDTEDDLPPAGWD